jgi:hypothetical protein
MPIEPVYFFYCMYQRRELFFHLPVSYYARFFKRSRDVKWEYPDGLDIRVYAQDYRHFEEEYGFDYTAKLPWSASERERFSTEAPWPQVLWDAFHLLFWRSRKPRGFHGYGFIKTATLEGVAMRLYSAYREILPSVQRETLGEHLKKEMEQIAYWRLLDDYQARQQYRDFLNDFEMPEVDPTQPIYRQEWSDVPMIKGQQPLQVFIGSQPGQ